MDMAHVCSRFSSVACSTAPTNDQGDAANDEEAIKVTEMSSKGKGPDWELLDWNIFSSGYTTLGFPQDIDRPAPPSESVVHISPRTVRVLLMPPLVLIRCLESPEDLVKAWVDCYRCNFRLWMHGFRNTDINLDNMMRDPVSKRGILCSFDLARICHDNPSTTERERPGTVPFMALEEDYRVGRVSRLHRHELELCIWVLTYALLLDAVPDIKAWDTEHCSQCRKERNDFLSQLSKHRASFAKQPLWETISNRTARWLDLAIRCVRHARYQRGGNARRANAPGGSISSEDEKLGVQWTSSRPEAASAVIQDFEEFLTLRMAGLGFVPLMQDRLSVSS
ncbi:uncharacterized protein FIBRA_04135 [Fibroporia radiculosa]|uniref:Fungal-type protein kinase domain-containing protein n=1 Tax=Fibroporia radiculosa TaxID=599839 RepID=J4H2T0_9APHY|nr:uncharacterized protein FIBRA_04135 [Fibroporia radiculosa]CCM02059.1 predicted protein [Fibroporia radiculosa]